MKYLKIIDLIGQTLIIAVYLFGSIWIMILEQRWDSFGLTTSYAMFYLGCWQMISCITGLILRFDYVKARVLHFSLTISYFILSFIAVASFEWSVGLATKLIWVIMIGIPVLLAANYYRITYRWVFPLKSTSKFLPHIGFQ